MKNQIADFIAIGVGPFNLGLACLTAPIEELNGVFLDKADSFDWHPGMMLQHTTLQIPFMADLVTLADPTNPFSFLNYSKEQGLLYSFYIRENFLLLRNEYNKYCQWAINKLSNVHFQTEVVNVEFDEQSGIYTVFTVHTKSGETKEYQTKKLVLGTGTQPYVPAAAKNLKGRAIHSSAYLNHKEELQKNKSITVLGSGQSAAEIFHDLLLDIDSKGYELNWITRSPRFFPLEYSKLTLEMTSPEYVDYFYELPAEKRDDLIANQKHLYKGINQDLINEIHDVLYMKRSFAEEPLKVSLRTNSELIESVVEGDEIQLKLHQVEEDKYYQKATEGLVLSTGYHYKMPAFIEGIKNRIVWDEKGRYDVGRNYTIDADHADIFVQNVELYTHGFVSPDLGMACYRNSYIIKELTGKEYYKVEKRIAFQQFQVNSEEEITQPAKALI
jgi:lysine N6-hydroxylase